jgi:class III cytochrome C family protein
MKMKAITVAAYWLGLLAAAGIFDHPAATHFDSGQEGRELRTQLVRLNSRGVRGPVFFNHKNHEAVINPDPSALFKTKAGASCSGCHHTTSTATGTPQLWKCTSCHRGGGDEKNPRTRDQSEAWSKTAFHRLCIGCHQSSNKGPIKCGDCHRSTDQ